MIPVIAFLLGFAFGWHRARKRDGDRLDQLQYAAVHGILFTIVSLFGIIAFERLAFA